MQLDFSVIRLHTTLYDQQCSVCVFQGPADMRKIPVPAHRYTPLKENWLKIFTPIVENLQLQVRFNLKTRNVEIKVGFPLAHVGFGDFTEPLYYNACIQYFFSDMPHVPSFQTCKDTQDITSLQRATDFVRAFVLGFQVEVSTWVEGFGELCMFQLLNDYFCAKQARVRVWVVVEISYWGQYS